MGIEFQFLDYLQTFHTPLADAVMIAASTLGNGGILWILLTIILLCIPKTRTIGIVMAVSLCIDALLCNVILKPMIARIRPYHVNTAIELLVRPPRDYSFPSGHTAASFAAVAALFFTGQKKMGRIFLIAAILIAFSRMYLYIHYPTDILGGVLVGVLSGYLGYVIMQKIQNRK